MSIKQEQTAALDEAYERMASSDFELPNGFVNHGPMACEALDALGCEDQIDAWARRFERVAGGGPEPAALRSLGAFDWRQALGDYKRLPEWLGYFEALIAEDGPDVVVADWVPRLIPALSTALFHGAIRTAHAVRAVSSLDRPVRRDELARSLGYWAARFRQGQAVEESIRDRAVTTGVLDEAANGARHYVADPNIFYLHGVTGAMAVQIFVDHVDAETAQAALAQVKAEHAAMYDPSDALGFDEEAWEAAFAREASESRDPHQVKLVEACRRGYDATGDGAFVAAASTATRRR